MCPAADEAADCVKEEITFRFYNCVPQYPNLNRDIWLSYERLERGASQSDSLLVVCVNIFGIKKIGKQIAVPDQCVKCIFSLTSHKNAYVPLSAKINPSPVLSVFQFLALDATYKISIEKFAPFKIIN